jgi:Ca2+-binding EF-hand superfamily protein
MMSGPGLMGPGMMPMMFVMMDTDGDGAISFEEMQAVHKRMFDLVDEDKDGKVTIDEMHAFWGVRRDRE